jgi:hypothetical protein
MPTRASKTGKRRDFTQIAKDIIDQATESDVEARAIIEELTAKRKNPNAVALSKLGASKGGKARAKSLSAKKRREIAKKAAQRRWNKESGQQPS